MVDNNGFIVIAEDPVHTGKFFGEVDGAILESLTEYSIFRQIKIYDYQAICLVPEDDGSAGNILLTVSLREVMIEHNIDTYFNVSCFSAVQDNGLASEFHPGSDSLGHCPL